MKKVTYLIAPVVILALLVLGCGHGSPTASNANEVVPQIDAPTVASEDEVGPLLTPLVPGNPIGSCCPEGFTLLAAGFMNPADLNGDGKVCKKIIASGTHTIDNNAPCLILFP